MLLSADQSMLLVVDIQEKLTPLVENSQQLIDNSVWLLKLAQALNIPALASEHYVKGLGKTIKPLRELLSDDQIMHKVHFSCAADEGCVKEINSTQKQQVVITGIEAHICVLQAAIGLQEQGKQVFVVADAVASRSRVDYKYGLKRLIHSGVQVVTKEMVFFEWLHQAGTEQFKTLLKDFMK